MMTTITLETTSAEETIAAGHTLATYLKPPLLLILTGDLGAGKTTLVKGIAEALGAADPEDVTSPTFTLVHEYEGKKEGSENIKLYHLDLYRLEQEPQLATLGIEEMRTSNSIVLIEWGEKFLTLLHNADGQITLAHQGETTRTIQLQLHN